ncbi:hypothetical protein K2173_016935 [Erythroxylum novogranatense]|uniref:protein-tyrosine-phosphatase n=1 Tax=Erythroxylum novogranatense TaxID=1862640 RepID=A0AAV8U8I7_9ROSI|nr:hypothetical protein K2173_016935 [Erythroxylum novogranatense]
MDDNSAVPEKELRSFAERAVKRVYIWDMDETLILLKSLLNGNYAEGFNGSKDIQKGITMGKMWEKHILQICDELFFYEEIENYNMPFLDALSQYDDGHDLSDYNFSQDGISPPHDDANKRKLAYRHRVIANKYQQGLRSVLDHKMLNIWDELYDVTDDYTDRWLSSARALLEQCLNEEAPSPSQGSTCKNTIHTNTKFEHINILVTSGSLIPSLVKCLLFRIDNLITHGNVYSSWDVGKPQCFRWIKERFDNQNVQFCVIGDGWEECEAAEAMQWPFVKIDIRPGGSHRFPGLTLRTLAYYFDVVYGSRNTEKDEDKPLA